MEVFSKMLLNNENERGQISSKLKKIQKALEYKKAVHAHSYITLLCSTEERIFKNDMSINGCIHTWR